MTESTKYIAYYRVSTAKQEESGLGLEAQAKTVQDYVTRNAGEILSSYTEIQSGTGKKKRVEVYKAISECRAKGAILIVAKLDRLARDAQFIGTVQKMDIEIVFCDMPSANKMMIGFLAQIAQYEAELISQRTISALQAKKARGERLGNSRIHLYTHIAHSARDRSKEGVNTPNDQAMGTILSMRGEKKSYVEIAGALNDMNLRTTYDKSFSPKTVERICADAKARIKSSSK